MRTQPSNVAAQPEVARSDAVAPAPTSRDLPAWFVVGLTAAISWCAAAGVAGTMFLVVGWYQPVIVALVATATAATVAVLAARRLAPWPPADHAAAVTAVMVALVFLVFAGGLHSEHVLVDRDPAVYIVSGRSLAGTHKLHSGTNTDLFTGGTFRVASDAYDAGWFPMLPVLLAQAWSAGGDPALFFVGPLLGALGVLAAYALAARVLGTRGALVSSAFLVVVPLQLWFARDAYSEPVLQVLALGGLWVYLEARRRRAWPLAVVAGALVASAALARIDALAIFIGVIVFGALEWVRCERDSSRLAARRTVALFLAALFGGTLVALLLTAKTSGGYIGKRETQFGLLLAAFAVAVLGSIVVVLLHRKRPGIGRSLAERRWIFVTGVAAAAAVCLWAYVIRPLPRSALPVANPGVPVVPDPVRASIIAWHYSRTLHWFSAYLGVVALVIAFVGFVVLADRARRGERAPAAVVLVVLPVAVLYLARPSITPDQPWAMRRFVPVVLPGIAIAIAAALQYAWRAARSVQGTRARGFAALGVGVLAALVFVPAAHAASPFVRARAQHGAEAAVHGICRETGSDAAVVVFGGAYLDLELPDTVHAFCGVPTAQSYTADLPALARTLKNAGRRLVVLTASPTSVMRGAPNATIIGHHVVTDDADPERVFDRAPRKFQPIPTEIWVMAVPA